MQKVHEYILGVHVGHDATVALIEDGVLIEAMGEERLSRQKKHIGFPHLSLAYIKAKYKIETFSKIVIVGQTGGFGAYVNYGIEENIAIRDRSVSKSGYLKSLLYVIPFAEKVYEKYLILRTKFAVSHSSQVEEKMKELLGDYELLRHHTAHAWASVPFMDDTSRPTLVCTLDGAGDDESGTVHTFVNGMMHKVSSTPVRASLGLLYCAVTDILGMKRNEHEFKVMGLAPYAKASSGEKVYEELQKLVWLNKHTLAAESSINLELATGYLLAKSFYRYRFDSLAYGVQRLTEKFTQDLISASIKKYNIPHVALGGGVFMNVKANQYLLSLPEVASLTVTPSCGDESLAIGAAVYGYAVTHNHDLSKLSHVTHLYLGSEYNADEIEHAINHAKKDLIDCTIVKYPQGVVTIEEAVAGLLAQNSVVGRLSGRAEWGARALGNRSILANPTSRDNVKLINEMIKGRDFWMPFATSMLEERVSDYLHVPEKAGVRFYAPYMAITFPTYPRAHSDLIAALHPYDLTSRPQMVQKSVNPEYHRLISRFSELTRSGGILNTSFNLHGEPNVESPVDAIRTFLHSGLPHVAIGDYLISKKS